MVLSKPFQIEVELPPPDERLVAPGTPYEMYDGELVHVPPADRPHGERHSRVSGLIEACVRPEFSVAIDVLTRTSRTSDIAPDITIWPRALDPVTGRQRIAELAFEVVSTQSLDNAADKARRLVARGVRRVFAIDVESGWALEWSEEQDAWQRYPGTSIDDPVLAVPLPVLPLARAMSIDDAMARALVAKNNPVIAAEKAESRRQGRREGVMEGVLEGVRRALLQLLAARGVALDPADRSRILGERDLQRLERWFSRAANGASLADILADP
ncbi:MAG TPA: Uma2 family endonuclease [Kofleriaceae bacterium]|jgi:Uma2 family endonuclease|nr:Uma2 family endonuclease [Kofleriaceae bacterium]